MPQEPFVSIDQVSASCGKDIRLVAIDMDGTLLNSQHRISAQTARAIAAVRARGIEVLLASSRGPCAIAPSLVTLDLLAPTAFVGSQGAIIGSYMLDGGLQTLYRETAPIESAKLVVKAAQQAGICVSWYAGAEWYVSGMDQTIRREAEVVEVEPVVRVLEDETDAPDKLMLIAPGGDVMPLRRIAEDLPAGLMAQTSNPTYLEITRTGVDKGATVARYCEQKGVPREAVMAFGDGPNDLSLFAYAGISIAPSNARPEVRASATYVTRSNDADGVAYALERLFL